MRAFYGRFFRGTVNAFIQTGYLIEVKRFFNSVPIFSAKYHEVPAAAAGYSRWLVLADGTIYL